jgi:hypothetical protein
MQTSDKRHLTQKDGHWSIINLETWTTVANLYIPLKRQELNEIDDKIRMHLSLAYDMFITHQDQCLPVLSSSFTVRSPYRNTKRILTVPINRALLSIQFDFSYMNWPESCPRATQLGRVCSNEMCCNPWHHRLGYHAKASIIVGTTTQELPDLDKHQPTTEDTRWVETYGIIWDTISWCRATSDMTNEQIIDHTVQIATDNWGDAPLPVTAGYVTIREAVVTAVIPTGEKPRIVLPANAGKVWTPMEILKGRK